MTVPTTPDNPPDSDHPAAAMLRALVVYLGLMRRVMQPYFQRFGISGAQWLVLSALYHAQQEGTADGITQGDLSNRLIIRPPSVTGVIDRLARQHLVRRRPTSQDRRVKRVSLTRQGRQVVERILVHHDAKIRSLAAGITVAEQTQAIHLLERLNAHLQTLAVQEESAGTATRDDLDID